MNAGQDTPKTYTNGEITVIWKPALCQHSQRCFKELPTVFDPQARPWVTMTGATSGRIAGQVDRCPPGALSYTELAKQ